MSSIVDDKEVLKALSRLSPKQMNKAYKEAMKQSLKPIQDETKGNLRKSGIRNVSRKYVSRKNGGTYPSMVSGVKLTYRMKDDEEWGKVHIMGEFRLKWFEKGTGVRYTRKGQSRGSIKPYRFFRKGVDAKSEDAVKNLEQNIRENIIRTWKQ